MKNGGKQPKSWKGSSAPIVEQPRFGWQTGQENSKSSPAQAAEKKWNGAFVSMLILSLGLLSTFIFLLLHAPIKTPVITILLDQYSWPLPPNPWAREDVDGFSSLDGKTIGWLEAGTPWKTKAASLEDLRSKLRASRPMATRCGALVLYLSAHGVVNDDGVPCILPTGANILETQEWITLTELTDLIGSQTPKEVRIVLALDCVHHRTNWQIGEIDNLFVKRMESWFEETRPNLSMIVSSSADEQAWSGQDLQGSVFGKYFRLGLAGAADARGLSRVIDAGDGDGNISLMELFRYVRANVYAWSKAHRGIAQTPKIFPSNPVDFRLSLGLRPHDLLSLVDAAEVKEASPPSVSVDDLSRLWNRLDGLRNLDVCRFDPRNWHDLEQRMLWLEQLSISGKAYSELAAKQLYPELDKQSEMALRIAQSAMEGKGFATRAQLLQSDSKSLLSNARLPSIALSELNGILTKEQSIEMRGDYSTRLVSGSDAGKRSKEDGRSPFKKSIYNELNFIALCQKYELPSLWPDSSALQELLALRDQCEQLAVHGDLRAHSQKRRLLASLDQVRREMEDRLLAGPIESASREIEELRGKLQSEFDRVRERCHRIELAWKVRDQSLAEIPYLARWIGSPYIDAQQIALPEKEIGAGLSLSLPSLPGNVGDTSDPMAAQRELISLVLRLIRNTHELGQTLHESSQGGTPSNLFERSDRVQRDLDTLRALVDDRAQSILDSTSIVPSTPVRIAQLLGLPMLKSEKRTELKQFLEKHFQQVQAKVAEREARPKFGIPILGKRPSDSGTGKSLDDEPLELTELAKAPSYAEQIRTWESHPLLALLKVKAPADLSSDVSLEGPRTHALIRRQYRALPSLESRRVGDWIQGNNIDLKSPSNDSWESVSLAEHLERAMIVACPLRTESDSLLTLRTMALQDLLVWYAERTLADFYADAEGQDPRRGFQQPFFQSAAYECIDAAKVLTEPSAPTLEELKEIVLALEMMVPYARNGMKAQVNQGVPSADLIGGTNRQLELAAQPSLTFSTEKNSKFAPPRGTAFVLLRDQDRIVARANQTIQLPLDLGAPPISIPYPAEKSQQALEGVIVFRGHEFGTPILASQAIVVDFQPKRYSSSEIVLFGDRQRQPSIVFVLDCSWSMGESLPIESLNATSASKLDLAKQHILRMIEQMASQPDSRVGVRLFGHRLGWSRPELDKSGLPIGKTQVIPQPNYPGSIPQDVVPSTDVEAILPLGRFSGEMVGGLSARLSKIVPWGQSPLYYAIIQSLQDFAADDRSTAKSIVVITDGDNFQFNASGRPGGENSVTTTLEDVERAWKTNKIPLYVLGVGISENEDSGSRKNLKDLVDRTSGRYYDVDNGSDLLRALSEQLSLGTYQVSESPRDSRSKTEPLEVPLNSPVTIENVDRPQAIFDVSFQETMKSIQLHGGESLEMFLRGDGQDIVAKPFDRMSPKSGLLRRSGDSSRFTARVHRPSKFIDGVLFPISLQDPDSHYTPRPNQLWIEIAPVGADRKLARHQYLFYDLLFEPQMPVPIVSWKATHWPASANVADVRIWVKNQTTPSALTIPLTKLRTDLLGFESGVAIPGIEDAMIRVQVLENRLRPDLTEIQITELHGERSPGVGSIRILLEGTGIDLPERVTRRFEPENRMALHSYLFRSSIAQSLLRSVEAKINIASRVAVLDGAFQLEGEESIRVEIVPESELLPLPSATAGN